MSGTHLLQNECQKIPFVHFVIVTICWILRLENANTHLPVFLDRCLIRKLQHVFRLGPFVLTQNLCATHQTRHGMAPNACQQSLYQNQNRSAVLTPHGMEFSKNVFLRLAQQVPFGTQQPASVLQKILCCQLVRRHRCGIPPQKLVWKKMHFVDPTATGTEVSALAYLSQPV
jgi:hypothetical protein